MVAPGPADQLRAGPGLNAIRAATGEEARLIAAPQRAQRTRRKAQGLSGAVDTAGSCTTRKAWTLLGYAVTGLPATCHPLRINSPAIPLDQNGPSLCAPCPLRATRRARSAKPGGTGAAWGDRFAGARVDRGRLRPPPVSCASSGRRIRNWSWTTACGRAGIPWPRCRPCRAGTCAGSRAFAAPRVRSAAPRGGYRNGSR